MRYEISGMTSTYVPPYTSNFGHSLAGHEDVEEWRPPCSEELEKEVFSSWTKNIQKQAQKENHQKAMS